METMYDLITDILEKSGTAQEMSKEEQEEIKVMISIDMNQFILEKLFLVMKKDDIKKIDELMESDDQAGIADIFDKIGEDEDIARVIDSSIDSYVENITTDFKRLRELISKNKQKKKRKSD